MLDPLFDVIASILAWFYSLWPSYGVSIALLTLTAVLAVTPLTLKSTRSMLQMQRHMPEIKRLQTQHRGDREAMNAITMSYYKEHGINPVGCLLPMLVQGPIFIVMYRVVHGLTRRSTEIGSQLGFTSRRFVDTVSGGAPQYGQTPVSRGELAFDPDFLSRDTDLYDRLSGNVEMVSWGVDLSRSTSSALGENVVAALPYLLMLVIVLITGLYQQRQIQGRQSSGAMNPQQQMMMKLIPYLLPVISYGLPAAVVIYFIVSNLVRIAQQAYITRSFYRGEDSLGAQVAKQRATEPDSAASKSNASTPKKGGDTSGNASTPSKGAATPRRERGETRTKAPARSNKGTARSAKATGAPTRRGKTGKAPSRSRPSGGRVTPPGQSQQNRSRNKKKRR